MKIEKLIALGVALLATLSGCTCGRNTCELGKENACDQGFVCEPIAGQQEAECFPETTIEGQVFDATDDSPIEGARVVAIDATTNAPASNVVLTDADGHYVVPVTLNRATDAAADVKARSFTLRVSAETYQDFPSPIRQAIPLNVTRSERDAVATNTRDVALLPIEGADPASLGTISGVTQEGGTGVGGVLVVASSGASAVSTLSDRAGGYTLLNVPAGTYRLDAYFGGKAFDPVTGVAMTAGEAKTGVDLNVNAALQLSTVSGSIQLVNPQTTTTETLIVLALASTGEVPPGLAKMTVAKSYEIAGVPPGSYDILASYNNDDLVLDPDPSQLPRPIRINLPADAPGGTLATGQFKITGDVKIVSPGNDPPNEQPIDVTGLVLKWEDDAGEDIYGIEVFDAFGTRIWGSAPSTSACPTVSAPRNSSQLAYGGPALVEGQTYQWRVTSYSSPGLNCAAGGLVLDPISRSENLRGIFTVAIPPQ